MLVRVTPGVEAHTHEYIETGTEASKFGFTVTDERRARRSARGSRRSAHLELVGLHCHIGSQIYVLDSYARADRRRWSTSAARARRRAVSTVAELNLGGGLGARYLADDPVLDVADYARVLRDAVADAAVDRRDSSPPRGHGRAGPVDRGAGGDHRSTGSARSRRSPGSAPTSPSTAA